MKTLYYEITTHISHRSYIKNVLRGFELIITCNTRSLIVDGYNEVLRRW